MKIGILHQNLEYQEKIIADDLIKEGFEVKLYDLRKVSIEELETNDIISKIDTKGNIAIGIPEGQNNFRNLKPFLKTPYPITKLITIIASVNVTIIWLVVVKKNGIIPNRFAKSMNINRVKTNGKNFKPSFPAADFTMSATNS